MRYLIASLLTPQSDQDLRKSYQDFFNHPCPIRTLHLTFIPPFTTNSTHLPLILSAIKQLPQMPTIFVPKQPELFNHGRKILYLPLTPIEPLGEIYHTLLPSIRHLITFESADFPADTIPEFLPHLTLNYDFNDQLYPFSLPSSLTLNLPTLLNEFDPGIWQPYQS